MGRRLSDASPVTMALNFCPARIPSRRRAVVPELPQFKRDVGAWSREPVIPTPDSRIVEIFAPSCRNTRALDFTSSPVSKPLSSLFPFANAASMSTRWEILLSPGGRTVPPTRRTLGATDPAAPGGRAREPGGEGARVPHLERALDRAEGLFEGAQRRQYLVAVHQENFRPQLRLTRGQSCGVRCSRADGRARRRMPRQKIAEQRGHHLRHVTRRRELRVVAGCVQHDRLGFEHVLPEVRYLPRRIRSVVAWRDVDDGTAK